MNQHSVFKCHKSLFYLLLLSVSIITSSCASSSKMPIVTFKNHKTLTSGIVEINDTLVFPNHFIVEQNLSELNFGVQVSAHKMNKGDEAAVCVWVDGENHADAVVYKYNSATEYVIYRLVVNGEVYPICSVFMGFPSKHQAHILIKQVDGDIVFCQPYDREVARISLSQLYHGASPEQEIRLVMYAVHDKKHRPCTVDFDY